MTETTQRLFVAAQPPEHVADHLDELVSAMCAARPDLSWVSTRMWHVTVAFMPHVTEDAAEALPGALAVAARDVAPVRIALAGAGRFDEHVLWCGLTGDVDGLATLSAAMVGAGASVGAGPEQRRAFRPHLSLARSRGRLDARLGGLAEQLEAYEGPTWQVDEVSLVRSFLGRAPRHEVVAVFPLGG